MEETQLQPISPHDAIEAAKKPTETKMVRMGKQLYGENFTTFQKVGEIATLIPVFKEFYYENKIKNPKSSTAEIIRNFNKQLMEIGQDKFHPHQSMLRYWRNKWDLDIEEKMKNTDLANLEKTEIQQIIRTRNADDELLLGGVDDSTLEDGIRSLGGELLNDAFTMLRSDQNLEEAIDDEILIKRRNYILNVFGHVTKLVHGKAALMLKASEEKRNNASFLMTILASATAGKISEDQLGLLKTQYNKQPVEAAKV